VHPAPVPATELIATARALLDERDETFGRFEGYERELLDDLIEDPNRYTFDLCHQIEIAPRLPLLAAVRAVHPYLRIDRTPGPGHRRWDTPPSRWLLTEAIRYGLTPLATEQVPARELRYGDIVILGEETRATHCRVTEPRVEATRVGYTAEPLHDLTYVAWQDHDPDHPVTRKVRPAEPPAGTSWPLEIDQPPRTDPDGLSLAWVEVHGVDTTKDWNARCQAAGEFVRDQISIWRIAYANDGYYPLWYCRHGESLVVVAYEPFQPDPSVD
jgi:hypothetical protein